MINGYKLALMFISGANNLYNNSEYLDKLNVFPVPDGDTGKNMQLTLSAMATALNGINSSADTVAEVAANATLRSARGNSGVILSQLMRGFARQAKGNAELSGLLLAKCLQAGAETAYRAVMKPTEGTILTVARESAESALKSCNNELDCLRTAVKEGEASLQRTPELLPKLKEAGVVDAGGMGWICFLQGMLYALENDKIIEKNQNETTEQDIATVNFEQEISFTYCTEFLIHKFGIDSPVASFKAKISELGDSMMVIDDFEIVKVHIHTDNPGTVMQEALKVGSLDSIKIDNMREQNKNINSTKQPPKPYAIVAVASGDGITEIFKELGVDKIIQGGQTMNPSSGDILKVIDELNAENVLILPNNSNIILAAQQASELHKGNLKVITSKTIPQGIAAAIAFNPEMDFDTNVNQMNEASSNIKTGLVTYAVRDSKSNGVEIKEGDFIGILDGAIVCTGATPEDVCTTLSTQMEENSSSIITIYYGMDTPPSKAQILAENMQNVLKDCDISVYKGGQPIYYYMISGE